MTIPSRVLISDSPSAPASSTDLAIATMSVTSGLSLARTGTSGDVWRRTTCTTEPAENGSQANTWPRDSTFGHEMLTSSAAIPGSWRSRWASFWYSCTDPPAMETTVRMPRSRSHRRSLAMNSSTPGPCRPIEFSIPDGVSAIRGVGRPERALSMIDLVTTAPIAVRSRNGASSRPAAAHPEAVSTGSGIWNVPRRVDMSTRAAPGTEVVAAISAPLPRVPRACPRGLCRRRTSGRRCPGTPGPSVQERTIRVTPSDPRTGSTQVMHTPIPHAIDSSTAHWLWAPVSAATAATEASIAIGPHA